MLKLNDDFCCRINTLSAENEQLRNDVSMLQEKLNNASLSTPSSSQCDTLSPVWLNGDIVKELEGLFIMFQKVAVDNVGKLLIYFKIKLCEVRHLCFRFLKVLL